MAYGKLDNGVLTYVNANFVTIGDLHYISPSKEQLATFGIYPVENVMEDGEPMLKDGVIYNYIGTPIEPSEYEAKIAKINSNLDDTSKLIEALERIVAEQGVTDEDKQMAQERIDLRDELGKIIVTEEGEGTAFNPYKFKVGNAVEVGMWYKTESGYIWECIKSGYPTNELDTEYFDVIGV